MISVNKVAVNCDGTQLACALSHNYDDVTETQGKQLGR